MKIFALITTMLIVIFCIGAFGFLFSSLRKRATKKYQVAIFLAALSLAIQFAIAPLRGYAIFANENCMAVSAATGFLIYLLTTNYFLKFYKQRLKTYEVVCYIALGILILQAPMRIFYFTEALISFPDFLLHLIGVIAGYCFYEREKIFHKMAASVTVLIVLFTYFYGYDLWIYKLNYGTYTGNVHVKGPTAFPLKDSNNQSFAITKGKIVMMDFWFIGCGACMREFPEFQKVYATYKNNPNVQFFSVNIPSHREEGSNWFTFLTSKGYNFPMSVCTDLSFTKKLNIDSYPTIILLDEQGDVVYKGDIEGAKTKIGTMLKQSDNEIANELISHPSLFRYEFKNYFTKNGREYMNVNVDNGDVEAIIPVLVNNWYKIEGIKRTKGLGYSGAELKGLELSIVRNSDQLDFVYQNVDTIVD